MSSFCEWEKTNGIVHLKLTGVDGNHYLTTESLKELRSKLAKIREDAASEPCRALITTSSMGSFCDGIDSERLKSAMNPDGQAKVLSDSMAAVIKELLQMPMLTVCAAAGNAASLGLALALAHDDLVVLSNGDYKLGMMEHGFAVQPHIATLLREKTPRWFAIHSLMSLERDGKWLKAWYFADSEGSSRYDVLREAKKLVQEWPGTNGEVHADMRKRLYRESWNAVCALVPQ